MTEILLIIIIALIILLLFGLFFIAKTLVRIVQVLEQGTMSKITYLREIAENTLDSND